MTATMDAPAVMYLLYAICALALTLVTAVRLARTPAPRCCPPARDGRMLVACRVGILVLTFGTTCDNARTFFGRFPSKYAVDSDANQAVSWFCVFTHECLAAAAFFVPLQLISTAVTGGERTKRRLAMGACFGALVLFVVGLIGFLSKTLTAALVVGDVCETIGALEILKTPASAASPVGLVAVFAYSFGMLVAGVVLCHRHGWGSKWLLFLAGNVACVVGQGLMAALGDGYKCYASNFCPSTNCHRHRHFSCSHAEVYYGCRLNSNCPPACSVFLL